MTDNRRPALEQRPITLLYSLESFRGGLPNYASIGCTVVFIFCFLTIVELTLRQLLVTNQHLHPLLEDDIKRKILSRHLGVDFVSCFSVGFLGWQARYILSEASISMVPAWHTISLRLGHSTTTTTRVQYEPRMFRYHPEAARIMVFFFSFQLKNLYDTIVWNDGPEFIAHHVFAMISSGGGIVFGASHFYGIFYFGISELSTGILTVLINFDDEYGIKGMAEAFPLLRSMLGGLFAVSFVVIRVFWWRNLTYQYFRDMGQAFREEHPRIVGPEIKIWFYINNISLGFITLLQIIWLFEIIRIAIRELMALL
mmetsp:Transcript_3530/g.3980  ORF Transcript_3530/g.3980 Transcript_3530/m.3980 type:complete len:312 (-) Transcript_3530:20-955(-)